MTRSQPGSVESLYLDLMKRSLTAIDANSTVSLIEPLGRGRVRQALYAPVRGLLNATGLAVVRRIPAAQRAEGRDWPLGGDTMVGMRRLDNLQECIADIVESNVPGDLLEAGVWRGGAAIFMRATLKVHGDVSRKVWAADSFQGLPPPDPRNFPADAGDPHHRARILAVSLDEVKANFASYGLLDDQARFLPGWFRDSLPSAPVERLALLRLDGDMYESTMLALQHLYGKLSCGGYLIVDDYGNERLPACRQAVDDYRAQQGITEPIVRIDWTGAYWKRER
jgi:O-methyltransferase